MKIKRPKKHLKNINLTTSPQLPLIDSSGNVPIDIDRNVQAIAGQPGKVDVNGMRLQCKPIPNNRPSAIKIVLDALRLLHVARRQWHVSKPGCIEPISLDSWQCRSCTVTFRRNIDSVIILATYSAGHLELSLPPPRIWKDCGLWWMLFYRDCCERNRSNPTPWLGRSCGCTPENKRVPVPKFRRSR